MRTYEMAPMSDARDDLAAIRDHIACRLGSPSSAWPTLRAIRKELGALATMPGRVRPVEREPRRSRGAHKLLVENCCAYNRVAEDEGRVYVLNVVYARASQRGLSDGRQDD